MQCARKNHYSNHKIELRESRGDVREISMFYAIKISPITIFNKEKIDNDY